jgi:hypothetical protein
MKLEVKNNIATLSCGGQIFSEREATDINIRKMEAVRRIFLEYKRDEKREKNNSKIK